MGRCWIWCFTIQSIRDPPILAVQKVASDDRVTGRVDTGVEGVGGYMLGRGGEVDNSVRALYQGGSRSGRIEA